MKSVSDRRKELKAYKDSLQNPEEFLVFFQKAYPDLSFNGDPVEAVLDYEVSNGSIQQDPGYDVLQDILSRVKVIESAVKALQPAQAAEIPEAFPIADEDPDEFNMEVVTTDLLEKLRDTGNIKKLRTIAEGLGIPVQLRRDSRAPQLHNIILLEARRRGMLIEVPE